MTELQNNLPPGWGCMFDEISGKYYYINHYTRTTTWEDPRNRFKPFQGTPKHLSNVPVEHIPLQDMRPMSRSPLTLRSAKVQDSSFTTASSLSSNDSDDSVAKLSAMFPTVSETHIKLLLKKYLNREALVISALQVEKYPITTPGPFSTPPPQRNIHVGLKGVVSRTGSPVLRGFTGAQGFRSSPKPHSSPKLKLSCRYMKSLFAHADETVILEVLQNNDNNIQKTSDVLKEMGYSKKDHVKPATPKVEPKVIEANDKKLDKPESPPSVPKIKTNEEKQKMTKKLQELFKDVPEHLISIALESVNFDEKRANQILKIMKQEDSETESNSNKNKTTDGQKNEVVVSTPSTSQAVLQLPVSQSRQSIKSLLKSEKKDDSIFSRVINENDGNLKTMNICSTVGHNPVLTKGPNQKLLLENYVQWQGSNNSIYKGPQGLDKGPNKGILSTKVYTPCGPNAELRKGPRFGLSKGSIFAQLQTVVVGESRVK